MTHSKLVVFEGIDNSGKTSISQGVLQALNEDAGVFLRILYANGDYREKTLQAFNEGLCTWAWTKQPDFSTEEADRLNDKENPISDEAREALFMASAVRIQEKLRGSSFVLDRNLWSGLAYAKIFSPKVFPLLKEFYQTDAFKKADLTIFVDTDVQICHEREPAVSVERLTEIREAYLETQGLVSPTIVTMLGEGSLEDNVALAVEVIKDKLYAGSVRLMYDPDLPFPLKNNMDITPFLKEQK